jgi:hypothetical protein
VTENSPAVSASQDAKTQRAPGGGPAAIDIDPVECPLGHEVLRERFRIRNGVPDEGVVWGIKETVPPEEVDRLRRKRLTTSIPCGSDWMAGGFS